MMVQSPKRKYVPYCQFNKILKGLVHGLASVCLQKFFYATEFLEKVPQNYIHQLKRIEQ